jgi:hypothetical protein
LTKKGTFSEDIQTQLMMLKKNEFYFKADKTPHSHFMEESTPVTPGKMFVKSGNPFDNRNSLENVMSGFRADQNTASAAIQLQNMMSDQKSITQGDPVSIAQSMKNPYLDDIPDEGNAKVVAQYQTQSRDTFNMNSGFTGVAKEEERRKTNINLEKFQTYQPGKNVFGENPYIDSVPNRTVSLNQPNGIADGTQPRVRQLFAMNTIVNQMKRPGQKQKAGISK